MKEHLDTQYKDIEEFFVSPPDTEQKAWGMINDFYHLIGFFKKYIIISRVISRALRGHVNSRNFNIYGE